MERSVILAHMSKQTPPDISLTRDEAIMVLNAYGAKQLADQQFNAVAMGLLSQYELDPREYQLQPSTGKFIKLVDPQTTHPVELELTNA